MKFSAKHVLASVAALLVVAAAHAASAQEMLDKLKNTTPKQRATIQTAFMKKKIGLEGAELAKVEAINMQFAEKAEPVIQGSDGPFMKMRAMKEIQSEKDQALQGVLTPAQFQAYKAAQEEMKQQFEQEIAKKAGGGS